MDDGEDTQEHEFVSYATAFERIARFFRRCDDLKAREELTRNVHRRDLRGRVRDGNPILDLEITHHYGWVKVTVPLTVERERVLKPRWPPGPRRRVEEFTVNYSDHPWWRTTTWRLIDLEKIYPVEAAPVVTEVSKPKHPGGRPSKEYWPEIAVEVGAFLTAKPPPHENAVVEKFMAERIVARGLEEPAADTLQRWRARFMAAFERWKAEVDTDN